MKLYDVYWNTMEGYQGRFAETIRDEKDCCFILIVTSNQHSLVKRFISQQKLEEFVQYEQPYYTTNGSHPEQGRRLTLICLGTASPKVLQLPTSN